MEQKTVTIRRDKNYGQLVNYAVCENARIFANIAGTVTGKIPTLTESTCDKIKLLGYEIIDRVDTW